VPLDGHVAEELQREAEEADFQLPKGKFAVIHLTKDVSDQYQAFATLVAEKKGIHRVHLDVYYWNGDLAEQKKIKAAIKSR
jgi:hypothetical protein